MTALETALSPARDGGQAVDLPGDFRPDEPREVRYLSWTIRDALRDAGVLDSLPYPPQRCGVALGTTLHGMRSAGRFLRTGSFEPLRSLLASHTLTRACDGLDLDGLAVTTCSACSSSLGAIALAVSLLEARELDLVVAGGYDTISEYVYGGFNALRLVADGPLRPFAKNRQGMKLAEGYGIVVLERADDAQRRSARSVATVLGFGESADAHHLTQPHPQGDGAARAIESALTSAGLSPNDIDMIAAHATGTPDNDAGEFAALSRVFGADLPRVPVVAFKSHLGHTLGGAGAVELILSAMAMQAQTVPPCANVRRDEIEFAGLNLSIDSPTRTPVRATLNASLGFGGANTAAVLSTDARRGLRQGGANHDVVITGIGVIVPGAVGNEQFVELLSRTEPCWSSDSGSVAESEYIALLNARRVRRMSEYVKLTLAATTLALRHARLESVESASALLGSMHGSTDFSATYYREIVRQGLTGANPVLFAEAVPNSGAAHLSLMLGLKGACQSLIGARTAGLDALHLASLRIRSGQWNCAIIGAAEEYNDIVNGAYTHCGLRGSGPPSEQKGFVTGSASVAMILESRESAERRGAKPIGRVLRNAASRGRPNESIDSTMRVLQQLGEPTSVLTSANGTWIDRAEAAAIRQVCPEAIVSSVYGHVAESFSAASLLSVAATLLGGALPKTFDSARDLKCSNGADRVSRFAAICTDFTGGVSGVSIERSID